MNDVHTIIAQHSVSQSKMNTVHKFAIPRQRLIAALIATTLPILL